MSSSGSSHALGVALMVQPMQKAIHYGDSKHSPGRERIGVNSWCIVHLALAVVVTPLQWCAPVFGVYMAKWPFDNRLADVHGVRTRQPHSLSPSHFVRNFLICSKILTRSWCRVLTSPGRELHLVNLMQPYCRVPGIVSDQSRHAALMSPHAPPVAPHLIAADCRIQVVRRSNTLLQDENVIQRSVSTRETPGHVIGNAASTGQWRCPRTHLERLPKRQA
ncbi:hypothetical protein KC363_g195 [Hortaea werneckii]|nr:hypothetical protein KC363_g195 [Hortaea werneckii]